MSKADDLFEGPDPATNRADVLFEGSGDEALSQWAGEQKQEAARGRGLLRAAGEGASAGFYDELSGAASAALPDALRNDVDRAAVGNGATFGERYRNARDYYRHQVDEARGEMPAATTAASLGGALLTPLGKGKIAAATMGALTGLGTSRADLTQGEAAPAARDTALGAGLGVAGQALGKAVGNKLQSASRWFGEAAENRALDAAGLMKRAREALLRKYGGTQAAGRLLLDEGLVRPLSSQSEVAGNLIEAAEGAGRDVGEAAKKIGDVPALNRTREQLAQELEARLVTPNAQQAGSLPLARAGQAIADDMRRAGDGATQPLDFAALRAEKAAMAGPARFDLATPAPQREAAQGAYKTMRELEDEYAQRFAAQAKNPALAEGLRSARDRAGMLQELRDAAVKRMAGYGANRLFSLTDNMAGLAGLLRSGAEHPDIARAGLYALANKAFREYGPAIAAVGADKASALLRRAASSDLGARALSVVLASPETQRKLQGRTASSE